MCPHGDEKGTRRYESLSFQDRRRKPRRQDPATQPPMTAAAMASRSASADRETCRLPTPVRVGEPESRRPNPWHRRTDEQAGSLRGRSFRKSNQRNSGTRQIRMKRNDVRKGEDHWGSRRRKRDAGASVRHRRVPRRIHIRRPPETGRCQTLSRVGQTVDAPAGIEAGETREGCRATRRPSRRQLSSNRAMCSDIAVAIPVGRTHFGDQDHKVRLRYTKSGSFWP